jgi:hypothetical protein
MSNPNLCGDCVEQPGDRVVIIQPPAPAVDDILIENTCPDRVSLPGSAKPKSIAAWLKALADQFCTLNPLGIRGAPPCQVLTTVADPRGGSMLAPRPVLEMLNCAPFTEAGQTFIFDGKKVGLGQVANSIQTLSQLTDGPGAIVPGNFLVGLPNGQWGWKPGCLPPCPSAPGLTLQSTSGGGMQWGPLQPLGIQCKDLKAKLATCLTPKTGKPDCLIGFGEDNCEVNPYKYSFCDALTTGLKDCVKPKIGDPTRVLGFDVDGNPFSFEGKGAVVIDCAALKAAAPVALPTVKIKEVYGVGDDGACARFVKECDSVFRAIAKPDDIATGTKLISAWPAEPLYSKMSEVLHTGECKGTFGFSAAGFQQYTVASAGRYAIEAAILVNVKFAGSGPGIIHADAVWSLYSAIVIASGTIDEYRLGAISNSIDYCYDPGNAYTVNNCTRGLATSGLDFFFTRTIVMDLVAGATISVPRTRLATSYNAGDISATLLARTGGQATLAVTKLSKPTFI